MQRNGGRFVPVWKRGQGGSLRDLGGDDLPDGGVGRCYLAGMVRAVSENVRHGVLVGAAAAVVVIVAMLPPIPQPTSYHAFADQRPWLSIPNALNVLSNIPFALLGWLGIAATFSRAGGKSSPFRDPWQRWPYAALFAGVALTGLGSSCYHWAPDNETLVWDRLPMAIGFMGLLTALLSERVSLTVARGLFPPLLAIGAGSVWYWNWTEVRGAGDLRPYIAVQFGSLLLVVLLLVLYPPRESGTGYLVAGLAAYAAAKGLEVADKQIFASLGEIVSGHTLKHLAAAGGVACLVAMLRVRSRLLKSSNDA